MLQLREELKESLKEGNEVAPVEPPMDFGMFKNLASEKAGSLEGYVVKIADGIIGTTDEEITSMITERAKLSELYYNEDNKTGHTFMSFLHFLYASLELTGRMVGYINSMVVNPSEIGKYANPCPNDPSDPIFSPMNDVLNNICVKCGSIKTDLFMISEEFGANENEECDDRRYDVNHTTGVLEYINKELFIILDSCDNILTTIYGEHWKDTETVCGCETKVVR